jgi:hypothetical protein
MTAPSLYPSAPLLRRKDTRALLLAGKAMGLSGNFHGDELNDLGCGALAAEVGEVGK